MKIYVNRRMPIAAISMFCMVLNLALATPAASSDEDSTDIELRAAAAARRDLDPQLNGSALDVKEIPTISE
jgi:hypothetical protein